MKNMSPTFNQDQDLVPLIGGYVGKLPEQHFNVWMCSNPKDNIFVAGNLDEVRI